MSEQRDAEQDSYECPHDLAERETACADGMCPICLAYRLADSLAALREREARPVGWLAKRLFPASFGVDAFKWFCAEDKPEHLIAEPNNWHVIALYDRPQPQPAQAEVEAAVSIFLG